MAIGYMAGPQWRGGEDDPRIPGDMVPEAAGWANLRSKVKSMEIVLVYLPDTPEPRRGHGRPKKMSECK